jgi:hypothetical protein
MCLKSSQFSKEKIDNGEGEDGNGSFDSDYYVSRYYEIQAKMHNACLKVLEEELNK